MPFIARIDTSANTCTSLLVNREFRGQVHQWAIVGAFGDNLDAIATGLARRAGLDDGVTQSLAELGRYLTYNSYGETIHDLLYSSPIELHERMLRYAQLMSFISSDQVFAHLKTAFRDDLAAARSAERDVRAGGLVLFLPPTASPRNTATRPSPSLRKRKPSTIR